MIETLYLIWRYLVYHKVKTGLVVASITLILYLPFALRVLVRQSAGELTARAEATPLLVGAKGSPLELVLNSLYFATDTPTQMKYEEFQRVLDSDLAVPVPLYTRFRSHKNPIVGTSLDYFEVRGLRLASGRNMVMLGECVIGSKMAQDLNLKPGDSVVSSPESVFDLAGVYPLKMPVAGILEPAGTPDDSAVFVDVKTTWVIEGLAHGHQDLADPSASAAVLKTEGNTIVANSSIVQFNEITESNADSFHFHGNQIEFPLTAVIAVPYSPKSGTMLQGRYLGGEEQVQIVSPTSIMNSLLETVLTVEHYAVAAAFIIGAATIATAGLVFLLSARLRAGELRTLHRIGGSTLRIRGLIAGEIAMVLLTSAILACAMTALTAQFGFRIFQFILF